MKRDTGGPAFPSNGTMGEVVHPGMTLRDYFAAKAMQGFMSQQDALVGSWDVDAESAYAAADAMIKESRRSSEEEDDDE